jgi:ABC-type multidrug transport system fused ATPase/permease subunit
VLARYVRPQWRRALLLGVCLVATIGLRLANPQLLRLFVDDAAAGAPLAELARVALLFLTAALVLQVVSVAEVWVAENVALTATNALRADLALHVLGLDTAFHAAHTPGELIERTDGDVATLANYFSRFVVHLVGNALLLVGILVLLTAIDPAIGAAVGASTGAGVVTALYLRRVAVPRHAALRQANAELFGLIEERLAGTEDVRANGGVPYVMRRLLERLHRQVWAAVNANFFGGLSFHASGLLLRLGTVAGLAVAAYLYQRGQLTIGTVYLVFAYSDSLRQPIEAIARQVQDLQQAIASVGRVRALLAERSAIADGPGASLPVGPLAVDLDDVTFTYENGEPVLRDVSLRLEPGQVLGLLGRTGSGKTTLARLLFRLHDPTEGAVRLGGVDLRSRTVAAVRARIGIVTQEVQLFHASVRDNVTFFDRAVPAQQVATVLEDVGLGPWLRALPDGLEHKLAPGGSGLSAGEAQLLAFARVFLKDPGLVVLDEASSRLDPSTERLLERAIDRLLADRTAIVIAHRLATVERADRIVVLEEGRIVEQGQRAELAADPASRFGRLLRAGLDGTAAPQELLA